MTFQKCETLALQKRCILTYLNNIKFTTKKIETQ